MRRVVAILLLTTLVISAASPIASAACPATAGMTEVHDGGRAASMFNSSPARVAMQALIGLEVDVSLSSTYVLRNGTLVVLVPLLRDGNLVGALAYNCRFGTALAYHYNKAGRVLMTYGDDEGHAWSRYWNTDSPSDVTVESFDCVDACVFGCMAVCAIGCVPTTIGYLACLATCEAGCTALCINMCESEGGTPGGPGGGPPAAESIGAVP